jgi:outer membrane protein assembly factor BamB
MVNQIRLVSLLAILTISLMLSQSAASSWPMFGYDMQHTNRSPFVGNPTPTKKWDFTTGGVVFSSPIIGGDGTVYVSSVDKKLYAINPDGSKKWEFLTGGRIFSSPAISADGTVIYLGSDDNKLYAVNSTNGTKKWEIVAGDAVQCEPVIGTDGTIYVGSNDYKLYAITPNGKKKWEFTTNGEILYAPAIGTDGTIYVGSADKNLYAIAPDGKKKWEYTTGDSIRFSPSVGTNDTIYVGSDDKKFYAVNPDGTKKWEFVTGASIASSPAISSTGVIYVSSADSKLYAININGTKKWDFFTVGSVQTSPAIDADGVIYVGSSNKKLYSINPNGIKIWEFATGDEVRSSPAIGADGTIYVGSNDNNLYAICSGVATLAITPTKITIDGGKTFQFSATPPDALTWTTTGGGNINSNGLFTADYTQGVFTVTVTSAAGKATAEVTINKVVPIVMMSPTQISPANNAANLSNSITLAWSPVKNATRYEYQFYSSSSKTVPVETNVINNVTVPVQYSLQSGATYSWRVRSIDANGILSQYSALWYFTTGLPTVQLISPADGAAGVPINTSLTWNAVANAKVYDIEVSTSQNFTNKVTSSSVDTTIKFNLAYNTAYFWRVRVKQGSIIGPWSQISTFTTGQFVPIGGLDATIADSKVGSLVIGANIIDPTGQLQRVQVFQAINRQSEFYIKIKNTGNQSDCFLISSNSITNSKWTVKVFDGSGIDQTKTVFGTGWKSNLIKPGDSLRLMLRFSASSSLVIDETNPPTQSTTITAKSNNDVQNGVTTPAIDVVTGSAILTPRSKL